MGFLTRLIAGFVAASTLGAGLAGTANAVDAAGAASDTTGAVTTTADDTGGRTVLDCRQSGEGATGPYADKFCWIDWSNLPLDSSGKPTPVRINVPGGHIDADATITHTDNAALTAKDYTGSKWSRLTSAYKLTGNTALAFSGRMGRQDPAASVTFSNVTPSADRTDTGVNVLKDFQLAFGDAEVMSGGVLQGHDVYEQTDIESDKTLEKLGMIGSGDPNQSYSKANTGYGTTHVTLAGGPKGATDDANKDSKGAAVVGAKQASRFKVSFGQVNQHWDGWGSAIAVGVYMPYLTAYPLTYDKNASDAAGEVPSNQRGKENTTQPAKTKTNGKIRLASDTSKLSDHLVNSDFEYLPDGGWKTISARYDMASAYTSVDPNNGQYIRNTRHADSDTGTAWVDWDGFDASKFAWRTDQKGGQDQGGLKDRANAVELQQDSTDGNTYAASNLPKQLVNSDFDHDWRNIVSQSKMSAKYNFANIDPAHGDVEISGALNSKGEASKHWVHLNGFDAARFGWKSNQTDTRVDGRGGIVEIQRSKANDNMYAEITASQANTYLYQDIDTAHDYPTVYTVKLRYAHRNGTINSNEKIQILVGAPGHEQPVEMTRIASDRGNKVGEKSTTVNAPNTDGWLGSWDTFQGSVVVPAGQDISRFTFKALGSIDGISGNLIDDVQFKLAYKLSYDKNSQDAFGQVPSDETANTVKQAKTRTTGTVRAVADRTASGLTVHDLETDDVPGDYRQFVLNTTDTRLSQVEFENGAWYKSTDSSSQGMWPLKAGASLTIPSVGDWTDPSGRTHQISMTMRLKDWNGGSVSELYRFDGHGNIVGDGRFWINTAYGSGYSSLPAKVEQAMGKVDTSKRVGCSWTVEFTYADTGEKVPDTFKGVTGFNDLDGWDAQSDLKFEGVQLLDGFNGAYKRSDAELGTYGTNGFAGIGHDAGDEAHLNAPQQSRHRLAATWTGSTFTFSYDLSNPAGRTDGSRMTFGAPVTRTAVLTYDKNAADASGQVPSNTTPDTTQTASSKSTGKVSDLVQRTTTHEDGSVTVKTIDTSTDVVSGCQVYYPAGQKITLATMAKDDDCWDSSMLSRPGHTQLGWNQDRNATQAQAQVTMVEGGMTVYAVWVGNPVLTYDTNKPSTWSGQMPSTPASVSVAYNTAAADGSGWAAGDTTKIRGYKFLGWYTAPQDNTGLYQWATPLTGNVTVYAHWQRLQANVVYNANGGTGSHPNTTGWQYSDVTIPGDTSKSFKRDKYVFKGWGTKPGKADVVYKDGSKVALQDKDITLYAQWQEVHENFVETGGIGLPIAIAGGVLLLMFGIGSTVMLTRRMNGHGMPDNE